jgi:hypothetical protein
MQLGQEGSSPARVATWRALDPHRLGIPETGRQAEKKYSKHYVRKAETTSHAEVWLHSSLNEKKYPPEEYKPPGNYHPADAPR